MKYNLDTTTIRLYSPDQAFTTPESDEYKLLQELEDNPFYDIRHDNWHDLADTNVSVLYPQNRFGYDLPPITGVEAVRQYITPYDRAQTPHLPTELEHTVIQEQSYPERVETGLLRQISLRTNQYGKSGPVIADYDLHPTQPVKITYGGFQGEIRAPRMRIYDHTEKWRIGRLALSGSMRIEDDICIERTALYPFRDQQSERKKWRAMHFIQQMAFAAYLYEIDRLNHETFDA